MEVKLFIGDKMKVRRLLHMWVRNWLELICSIISIITFTLYRPWWDFSYMTYSAKKQMKMAMDKKEIM